MLLFRGLHGRLRETDRALDVEIAFWRAHSTKGAEHVLALAGGIIICCCGTL